MAKTLIEHSKDTFEEDEHMDLDDLPKGYQPPLPRLHHTGLIYDLHDVTYPKKGRFNAVLIKIRNILMKLSKLTSEKEPMTLRRFIPSIH